MLLSMTLQHCSQPDYHSMGFITALLIIKAKGLFSGFPRIITDKVD